MTRAGAFLLMFLLAHAAQAETLGDELTAAQQLAWQKRFREAEIAYRRIVVRNPQSRTAILGLAQVLLWESRYADAARLYRDRLRKAPYDADARKGLATAEYWSGDYRAARDDFAAVLRSRPDDADSRKALSDIAATMSPVITSENAFVSDNQPSRRATLSLATTIFSDPLTKWTGTVGAHSLPRLAPFASIGVNAFLPAPHLRTTATLRMLRFPDGTTRPLGAIALAREWSRGSVTVEIDRHEILYAASAVDGHPSETVGTLAWSRDTGLTSSAAAIHAIRYFDRNRGRAAEAHHLASIVAGERVSLSAGASTSYRDTSGSRFRLIGASAAPLAGGGFAYSYRAQYDPYWTPQNLVELRGVVAATLRAGRTKIYLHGDGGWAHDRDRAFGPSSGTSSLVPLFATEVAVSRTFHPWRASASVAVPLRGALSITLGAEHQSTVFYRATSLRLGVVGRL